MKANYDAVVEKFSEELRTKLGPIFSKSITGDPSQENSICALSVALRLQGRRLAVG